ncbi:MAG: thioredoxin family protein [Chitinophagales bacterium]
MLKELTDGNFEGIIEGSDMPILVDFGASWCSTCNTLIPIVKELASEYDGRAIIGKIDVDSNPMSLS